MLNGQRFTGGGARSRRSRNNIHNEDDGHYHNHDDDSSSMIRDIHALTPPSSSLSMASSASGENFTTISREFNALVLAGSRFRNDQNQSGPGPANLGRIGNSPELLETNPLAIVADPNPPHNGGGGGEVTTAQRVKKEEAESKINAWKNAKIAKINNRFKREETLINGWEDKQVHKSSSWMKHVERKIEEKRAKAVEKMQNEIAKAHRKAEERRASAESKRGTKIARVLEIATLMRRAPSNRSFF